jgi:hypothetical protein
VDQVVIMVAGDDHDLGAGAQGGPDLTERLGRRGQRLAQRSVAQLQQVAQQHQAIAVGQRPQQRLPGIRGPEDVGGAAGTEVQVRDDQRSQRGAPATRALVGRNELRRRRPSPGGWPSGA